MIADTTEAYLILPLKYLAAIMNEGDYEYYEGRYIT